MKSVRGQLRNGRAQVGGAALGVGGRDQRRRLGPGEQFAHVGVVVMAEAQEAGVGGVFQQPAHEVGHAGEQIADRRVEPHAVAEAAQQLALRLGHAVEHLYLEGVGLEAEARGAGQGDRGGAEVVRAEGRVDPVAVGEEAAHQPLVVGVGVALLREDGAGQAVEPGEHHLVVPVGALDQAYGQRRGAALGQREQAVDVRVGAAQVGLYHDAEMRPGGKFGIGGQRLEEPVGDLVQAPLLEVEVDEGAELLGAHQQRPHPLQQPVDAAGGVGGVEQVVHRGELQGDVGARDGPGGAVIEDRRGLPAGGLVRQFLDELAVAAGIGLRLGRVDRGLAEQVDGEGVALVPEALEPSARLAGVTADDEALRHAPHVLADDESGDRRRERIFRGAQGHGEARGQRAAVGEEVLARVAGDAVAGPQRGQGVDEAEEVGLERGVAHGPVHHQALPVGGLEDAGRLAGEAAMQPAAEALNLVLEEDLVGVRQGLIFRNDVHAHSRP